MGHNNYLPGDGHWLENMKPFPTFDAWSVLFLMAAVQGLFVAFVFLRWRRGRPLANRLLASVMLLFAFTMLEYVLYWVGGWRHYPHVTELSINFPLLLGPLMWFYLRQVYHNQSLSTRDWVHFLPFFLLFAYWMPWHLLPAEGKVAAFDGLRPHPVPGSLIEAATWFRIAHMLAYAVWNMVYASRQARVQGTNRWARLLNVFFLGYVLAYASYFVLSVARLMTPEWDYQVSAAMTAFIYLIAYTGYVQPAVFEGYALHDPAAPTKYRNSGLTPEASRSLLQALNTRMQQEKIYQDPEISLEKLATLLGASKHHVSQVINEQQGTTFFEYINQLRVEEAKTLLAETSRNDLHVIEVAYAVGFNNKVSFNNAFKKATGMTPTQYRQSHGQSDATDALPSSS